MLNFDTCLFFNISGSYRQRKTFGPRVIVVQEMYTSENTSSVSDKCVTYVILDPFSRGSKAWYNSSVNKVVNNGMYDRFLTP